MGKKWHRSLYKSDSGYSNAVSICPRAQNFSKAADCLCYVDEYLKASLLCSQLTLGEDGIKNLSGDSKVRLCYGVKKCGG